MQGISRRRLIDWALVGGAASAAAVLPSGQSAALSLQPMDPSLDTLYRDACSVDNRHAALADALVATARASDVAIDEAALRRLLERTACPLCGCALSVG